LTIPENYIIFIYTIRNTNYYFLCQFIHSWKARGGHMTSEVRRYRRVKSDATVYYSDSFKGAPPEQHRDLYEGHALDLSPGGICISTSQEFELGSKMHLIISEHYRGTFTGVVRWCAKTNSKYHVGLEVAFSH
jgi:hypothetical protein